MKVKILIILLLIMNFTCQAQSEPEAVRGKDLIEKIDRSEIEANDMDDSIELDTTVPKMELQKIEFVKPKPKPKTKAKAKAKATTKTPSKPITEVQAKPKPVVSKKESPKKKKILISDRSLSLSNLKVKDKIVVNEGTTYVYRMVKSNTVQYKFAGKIPFDSKGLNIIDKNRYVVVDLGVLKADSKATKTKNKKTSKKPVKKPVKQPVTNEKSKTVIAKNKTTEPKKAAPKPVKPANVSSTDKIKRTFESKHNRGIEITETIDLADLLKNDIIHVSGDVKLVVRRNRNTYEMEYFWLIEKLDINKNSLRNTSFKALSDNRFKLTKDYEPKK